ncbi:scavenger receptor cysteine-rich protein isoform X8 [Strongylocentrotus purpuratus]|uniref:SRCR domain-containing protein n=1 Tax=Strongylocentrotus purpuratus TaxID=7668 RepID=A0A7M7T0D3_STRPU|nr:scavenger receptor cysteine-rich protein isoform X8 [Strongylocentrotus purpuratus]
MANPLLSALLVALVASGCATSPEGDHHCPEGMTFNECGSGCGPSSCENLPRDICPRICRAGCFCPEGLVKDQDGGDRCIPLDHCQDRHCPDGMAYDECGSGCGPSSCENLPRDICPRICRAGCFCPEGLVKDQDGGDRCIPLDHCQDRHCPDGMAYDECGSGCGPFSCDNLPRYMCPRICRAGCFCPEGLVKDQDGGDRCIPLDQCQGSGTGAIRLVGGSNEAEGRVEIHYNGVWGTICDDSWGITDASVVCRMLGFQGASGAPGSAHFGQGTGPIQLDDVRCRGAEQTIFDCFHLPFGVHNCFHSEDAGVVCNAPGGTEGDVRLVGGSNEAEGRVEIQYNGVWGTICDDSWGITDASVVCRMLGFQGASGAPGSAHFGQGTGPIQLDDVGCTGAEQTIFDCAHPAFGVHNCAHYEDAGVVCIASQGDPLNCPVTGEWFVDWDASYECLSQLPQSNPFAVPGQILPLLTVTDMIQAAGAAWTADNLIEAEGEICVRIMPQLGAAAFGADIFRQYCDPVLTSLREGTTLNAEEHCRLILNLTGFMTTIMSAPTTPQPDGPTAEPDYPLGIFALRPFDFEGELESIVADQFGVSIYDVDNICRARQFVVDAGSTLEELVTDFLEAFVEVLIPRAAEICNSWNDIIVALEASSSGNFSMGSDFNIRGYLNDVSDFVARWAGYESREAMCQRLSETRGDSGIPALLDNIAADVVDSILSVLTDAQQCSTIVQEGLDLALTYIPGLDPYALNLQIYQITGMNGTNQLCQVVADAFQPGDHHCPEGMTFNECGSGCGPGSCDNLVPRDICPLFCFVGCFCPEGLVKDQDGGDRCIPVDQCQDYCDDVIVNCLVNPCDVSVCSAYPDAECRSNYCGGCNADFYVDDVQVNCSTCPEGMAFNECGSGCGPFSCDNLPSDICPRICSAGCFCPEGLVKDQDGGDRCIPLDQCQGAIRLVGGSNEAEGRVEIQYNGVWGTICDDSWGITDANVVCRMLGFQGASGAPGSAHFGQGTGPIQLDDVRCRGAEQTIFDCFHLPFGVHNCFHSEDAGVVCNAPGGTEGDVRLVGGSNEAEGRVEIQYNGVWGTICDDSWDITDASVVCRMLGFQGASGAPGSAHFGQGTGPIQLDDVGCTGAEQTIFDCAHPAFGVHNCAHYEDAGVVCIASQGDPLNCPVTGEWFVDWDASYECLSQLPQSNPFAVRGQILPLLTVTDVIQAAGAAWTANNLIEAEGEICVRIMPQLNAAAFEADVFRQYCDPVLTSLREGTTLDAEEHCRLIFNLTGFMTTVMSAPTTPQPDGPTAEPDYPLGIFALRPFDFEGELEGIVADQFGVSIYDVDNICRARQFVVDAGSTLEELVTDFLEAFVEVLIPRAAEICNSWNDIIDALEASSSGNFSMGSDFNIRGYLNDASDFVARWAGYESREAMCQRLSETRGDSGIPLRLDDIAADVVDSILSVLTDAQQCSTIVQEGLDLALTYIPGLDPYALNLQIYQITGMNGTNQLCQVVADAFQPGDHHCPEGMTFNECGSGCGPGSCDNLVPNDICPLFCFAGCFCPEGLVKDQDGGDRCIPVDQCQAMDAQYS